MTTANKEADRIIADSEEAAQRYSAKDPADRLAYQVGVLQAHIRGLCHEAQYNSDELKKLQQEILWERKQ
jgi:vacuolar-type H+-ATPase subunit H